MVKKFQSRYLKIQRLREQQEETAKTNLAARNADLMEVRAKELEAKNELAAILQSVSSQFMFGVSGSFLATLMKQVEIQEQAVAKVSGLRHNAELLVQLATNELKAATIELKTVSELVNREKTEHRTEVFKQEDIQLQERAAHAWQRRRTAETEDSVTVKAESESL